MSTPDKAFWHELTHRIAPDPATMAAMERSLSTAPPRPLPRTWLDQQLQRATGSKTQRMIRRQRAAATAAVLLALAIPTIAAVGAKILWPSQRNSATTMSVEEAVGLLLRPSELEAKRMSATLFLGDHVLFAVRTMRAFAAATSPSPIQQHAAQALQHLRTLGDQVTPTAIGPIVDRDWAEDGRLALLAELPPAQRLLHLQHLTDLAARVLPVMAQFQADPTAPMLDRARQQYLARIAEQLAPLDQR